MISVREIRKGVRSGREQNVRAKNLSQRWGGSYSLNSAQSGAAAPPHALPLAGALPRTPRCLREAFRRTEGELHTPPATPGRREARRSPCTPSAPRPPAKARAAAMADGRDGTRRGRRARGRSSDRAAARWGHSAEAVIWSASLSSQGSAASTNWPKLGAIDDSKVWSGVHVRPSPAG